MKIFAIIRNLLEPRPKEKPEDQLQFDQARKELHRTSRKLAKQADAFGDLVFGMQGPSKKKVAKKRAKKKCPVPRH